LNDIWTINTTEPEGPIVAAALHDGHLVRPELKEWLVVDDQHRLREEDPYTGGWTAIGDIQITGTHSRFEVDLNRIRSKAVYLKPEDAWGIDLWTTPLSQKAYEESLARYDRFYATLHTLFGKLEKKYGRFIVYDLHSYNHRREGTDAPAAPEQLNPEINIGTGTMNRQLWAETVDTLINGLRSFDFNGRSLDVRENVKFQGGGFPRFVHENFPLSGCAIAIEVKKFWMDEWSGVLNQAQHELILQALASTVPKIRNVINQCG